jgi:hypothetical protein
MGKSTGLLGITGSIGNITIDKNGNARQKVGSNKSSFQGKDSMVRVRENASEFGAAGSAGKTIREALRSQIQNAKDSLATSRLTKVLTSIIKLDTTADRGMRQVIADNCASLLGFSFNAGAALGQSLFSPFSISAAGAGVTLSIPSLDPLLDVSAPTGATHFEVVFGAVSVDFAAKTYKVATVASPLGVLAMGSAAQTNVSQVATLPAAPSADELVIGVLGMNYYQRINGKNYPLNNNASNPLAVVYTSATGSNSGGTPVTYSTAINGPSQTLANTTITSAGAEKLEFDQLTSGSNAPYNMVISVGGVQKASVDTFDRYAGKPFRFTEANGTTHTGVFTSPSVNF